MLKESQRSALLGAAIAGDPSVYGDMNDEELKEYNDYVAWIDKMRAQFGDKFDEMSIDIPYSLEDDDE